MRFGITLLALVALLGCRSEKFITVVSPADYLAAVRTLDLDPKRYVSFQEYNDAILGYMNSLLKQMSDPKSLQALFYQCQEHWKEQPEAPQDRLQWICPYSESLNLIMYRLAEIRTPDAAKVLVDLFCDPSVGWDAGAAELAGDAVVVCGKPALPFLKPKKGTSDHIDYIIKCIERGETRGF